MVEPVAAATLLVQSAQLLIYFVELRGKKVDAGKVSELKASVSQLIQLQPFVFDLTRHWNDLIRAVGSLPEKAEGNTNRQLLEGVKGVYQGEFITHFQLVFQTHLEDRGHSSPPGVAELPSLAHVDVNLDASFRSAHKALVEVWQGCRTFNQHFTDGYEALRAGNWGGAEYEQFIVKARDSLNVVQRHLGAIPDPLSRVLCALHERVAAVDQ